MHQFLKEYAALQTQAWQVYFNVLRMWGQKNETP